MTDARSGEDDAATRAGAADANETAVLGPAGETAVLPAAVPVASGRPAAPAAPPPPPVAFQQTPAVEEAPPRRGGNRVAATFWVLFAALVFEAGYLLLVTGIVALQYGADQTGPLLAQFFRQPYITWLPVVIFAVLYEISVLILGRAGRFAYVVASLVVALLTWILSVQLILAFETHAAGTASAVAAALETPAFVLIGVWAREVMLWTGFAVGARGHRLRRRYRHARREYDERRRAAA